MGYSGWTCAAPAVKLPGLGRFGMLLDRGDVTVAEGGRLPERLQEQSRG